MRVENKIMYHFHNNIEFNDIWQVGNEFNVDKDFESSFCRILKLFNTNIITCDEKLVSFDRIIGNLLLDEKKLEDKDYVMKVLNTSKRIICNMNIYKREQGLEQFRKDFYPNLPSRLNSIWVTDKEQLKFWETELNSTSSLFQLSLTGELFKSSDSFLPDDNLNIEQCYLFSEEYWNPKFKTDDDFKKTEYLFQGHVKILKKQ